MPLNQLTRDDRLQLMKFVCSFAWADLRITESERDFVHRLVRSLKLNAQDREAVEEWLKVPPHADEVDPKHVPSEHRALFLRTVREMIEADGEITEEEIESFELIAQLLT